MYWGGRPWGRGHAPGRGGGGGARGPGGRWTNQGVCRNFRQSGSCPYGSRCRYSHDLVTEPNIEQPSPQHQPKSEVTAEQEKAKGDYNVFKRTIKFTPRLFDENTMEQLWNAALATLDSNEQGWKQSIPKDLDSDDYYGRDHIKSLIEHQVRSGNISTIDRCVRPFLLVMSHPSLLDCLSVDTPVGSPYNFISGTNGTRAIPFFQELCETMAGAHAVTSLDTATATVESTIIAMSIILRELLQRESRARFNDDLPTLIETFTNTVNLTLADGDQASATVLRQVDAIRALTNRAHGLLVPDDQQGALLATLTTSSYPRELIIPRDRHDNDKADIAKMKIFPTREEILSDEVEFLPSTDPEQPHYLNDPAQRHIDTLFRLLRYDTFAVLKEALSGLMHAAESDSACLSNSRLNLGDFRTHQYPGAYVSYVSFDARRGLEANLSFAQLPVLRKKSASERRQWWEESKALAEGVLLSFITVHQEQIQHLFVTVSGRNTDTHKDGGLTKEGHHGTITVKLASHNQSDVQSLIRLSCQKVRGVLIEYPKVLPATFVPILENIQDMQRLSGLLFRQWILPPPVGDSQRTTSARIPPALYARRSGFAFSLEPIMRTSGLAEGNIFINPVQSADDPTTVDEMEKQTHLDRGQCEALVAALTREFAFIQGPPGTGKSYLGIQLMRVLLHSKQAADLGPIVVVCYTNHALDQFLEHLLKVGISKLIRIGGQSQSTLLEEHNLRKVSQTQPKVKSEGYTIAMGYKTLDAETHQIQRGLGKAHTILKRAGWDTLQYHLQQRYPRIHSQFDQYDEDGFEMVGRHPFEQWIGSGSTSDLTLTPDELNGLLHKGAVNIHALSHQERMSLVQFWTQELHAVAVDDLSEKVKETDAIRKEMANVHDEADRRALQNADVIGITTTGLAKRMSVLRRVRCKVVICEEAGEVMEPHMVCALLPTVEHFIQIGDHQQLRPSINNYNLSLESNQGALYKLDRSQFERLSVLERGRQTMPVAQLNVQRRMRPEISRLIRETIYPRLVDHPSTTRLPDVVGLRNNVFWLDHDHIEEGQGPDTHHRSHANLWEAEMVHALVRHIVRQGEYSSSDIAVLTPYTGQLQKIRAAMRNDFEIVLSDRDQEALERDGFNAVNTGSEDPEPDAASHLTATLEKKKLSDLLRVATIDNFQGEEAKIVIVSLVRSNQARRVGFLRTTNRINVLLSRAQHGMFLIGNTDTYANVSMWQKVLDMLRDSESVGNSLDLCCPRHKDTVIQVSNPDDFPRLSPEGGCREACSWRLSDCGHMCQARCHSEAMHRVFSCPQPCQRHHQPCGHPCQKQTCGEDCGKCLVKLKDIQLPCGHLKSDIPCYQTQVLATIRCNHTVQKTVPGCEHSVEVSCSVDVTAEHFRCATPCGEVLPCGHTCSGTCGKCSPKTANREPAPTHQACQKVCGRPFGTCNHTCRKACHDGEDCGSCTVPCEVRCQHSQCTLPCQEACAPCVEKCIWFCEHQGSCSMPCSAPCDRLPCDKRCTKTLHCGHQCPGLCGEACPEDYCHQCTTKQDSRVDLLEMKTYAEVDVSETPIVVLGCGHFFTAETLDGLIGMHDVYVADQLGQFTGLADISGAMAGKIPRCPDCQCPVRQYVTQRYNRVINKAVIDEMSKRFLVSGQMELKDLEDQVDALEKEFERSRTDVVNRIEAAAQTDIAGHRTKGRPNSMVATRINNRYTASGRLTKAINLFLTKTADRHQPAHKLHEAIAYATTRNKPHSLDDALAILCLQDRVQPVEGDRRITLGGTALRIKAECIVLEDKFSVAKALESNSPASESGKLPGGSPHALTKPYLKRCNEFIAASNIEKLPKLAVEASLYFARIAYAYQTSGLSGNSDRDRATTYTQEAKRLLEKAVEMCDKNPFKDAERLRHVVKESIKMLLTEWYEEISPMELAAIKQAMVSGPRGIASHSGHWYNCANGHPFAIGECGMPMQQARCPECGAPIGGSNHDFVAGVTRATNLER